MEPLYKSLKTYVESGEYTHKIGINTNISTHFLIDLFFLY